jgi:hypothetical protein
VVDMSPILLNLQRKNWYAKAQGFYLAATHVVRSGFSFLFNILVLGETFLYLLWDVLAQIMLRIEGKIKDPPLILLGWLISAGLSHLGQYTLLSERSPRLALMQLWDFFYSASGIYAK